MNWKPISEELPESADTVLVWIEGPPGYVGMASVQNFGMGRVFSMLYPEGQKGNSWIITHWMDAPGEPK